MRILIVLLGLFLAAPAFAEDDMPPEPEIPEPEVPLEALERPSAGTLAIRALADFSLKHPDLMGDPDKFWLAWDNDPNVSPEAKAIIGKQREIARQTGENLADEIGGLGEKMREAAKEAGEEAGREADALRERVNPMLDQLNRSIKENDDKFRRYLDGLDRKIEGYAKTVDDAADQAK